MLVVRHAAFVLLLTVLLSLTFALSGFARAGTAPTEHPDLERDGHGSGVVVHGGDPAGSRTGAPLDVNSFGVQMYRDTRQTSTYNSFALQSSAGTVRVDYGWPSTAPENTDWTNIDKYFGIAVEEHGGLNVITTMCCVPSWAAPHTEGPLYDDQYPALAQFMAQVVERYDGDGIDDAPGSPVITYWELYNEPDRGHPTDTSRRWGHNGDLYAMMLQTVYPAIKAANPDAQVVMGGLAYDWFEDQGGPFVRTFIDDVLAAGGCAYFDVMNFHSFPFYASRWTDNRGAGVYEKTSAIRAKLAEYDCNRPIIITESGWHSDEPPWNPSSYEEQARYVPQLFTHAFAADVDMLVWWMLYDPPGNYWDNGLVTGDTPPQPKPSFQAYQVVQATLLGTSFSKRYTPEELQHDRMELYQFEDAVRQRTTYIAWLNPVESPDATTLSFSADTVTVQTLYGETTTVTDVSDGTQDGHTTVPITAQPTYVFIDYTEPLQLSEVYVPVALR